MAASAAKCILVTGASGLIGGLAAKALSQSHRVRALNRRDVPGCDTVRADITGFDAIRPAFEGVHTVVHLSALLIQSPDRDLLKVNVGGTYNVFEAARLSGVKRIVFASSGAVSGGYMREEPYRSLLDWTHPDIPSVAARLKDATARSRDLSRPWRLLTHLDPVRPSVFYGAAKAAGEDIGRFYHEAHGMSVICIRFGAVFPDNTPKSPSDAAVYMSHRDATQAIVKSVEAPADVGFEVFYALSDNATRFRDISHAREVIGFGPQDGVVAWPPSSSRT